MDDERSALLAWMKQARRKKVAGMGLIASIPVVVGVAFSLHAGVAIAPLLYVYTAVAGACGGVLWGKGARQAAEAQRFLVAHEGKYLLPEARVIRR